MAGRCRGLNEKIKESGRAALVGIDMLLVLVYMYWNYTIDGVHMCGTLMRTYEETWVVASKDACQYGKLGLLTAWSLREDPDPMESSPKSLMGTKVGGIEPPPGQCRNLGISRVPMARGRQMPTLDSFGSGMALISRSSVRPFMLLCTCHLST